MTIQSVLYLKYFQNTIQTKAKQYASNVILPGRLLECFSYRLLDNEMFFCHLTTVSEGTLMFRRGVWRENSV